MTHARDDFTRLLMETRPRPNSWPPSARPRTEMWVAQPQLRPRADRAGASSSPTFLSSRTLLGFLRLLKNSTHSLARVAAALHAGVNTRTGKQKGTLVPEGRARHYLPASPLYQPHACESTESRSPFTRFTRDEGKGVTFLSCDKTRGRPASRELSESPAAVFFKW